jgi:hypothetical protein
MSNIQYAQIKADEAHRRGDYKAAISWERYLTEARKRKGEEKLK